MVCISYSDRDFWEEVNEALRDAALQTRVPSNVSSFSLYSILTHPVILRKGLSIVLIFFTPLFEYLALQVPSDPFGKPYIR